MQKKFQFSDDNKRYHTYNYYLRKRFGGKVFKVALNAGLSCPNRDGKKGFGGCTYCSESGSGDFAGSPNDDVITQFNEIRTKLHVKWQDACYIPYFQASTNTYAPIETLRRIYYTALTQENVVGLSIATRADCISEEIAELLLEISKITYLTVELGLQTIHDETAQRINRCHTYNEFLKGYEILNSRGLNICIHIINGLPGETHEMMLETIRTISKLNIHSIKIHLLHIIRGTAISEEFLRDDFSEISLIDYVNIVCDQIELLPKEIIIQRVTGDGDKETLISPLWSLKKFVVMNEIDKELVRRNTTQASKCEY